MVTRAREELMDRPRMFESITEGEGAAVAFVTVGLLGWALLFDAFDSVTIWFRNRVFPNVSGASAWISMGEDLLARVVACIIVLIILMLLWRLAKQVNFDLWLYYRFWLKGLKFGVLRLFFDSKDPRERDVIASFGCDKDMPERPCFIRREHLALDNCWPNWNFAVITVFGQAGNPKIEQTISSDNSKKTWELHVNLLDESFGIYSYPGRDFLKLRFVSPHMETVKKKSKDLYDLMQPGAPAGGRWVWEPETGIPLRWASAGMLPIVKYKRKFWALLFFRDIEPRGLNIGNGASQNGDEYKNLPVLMEREFLEEICVFEGACLKRKEGRCVQPLQISRRVNHRELLQRVAELRKKHDNVQLQPRGDVKDVDIFKTPFRVLVTHEDQVNDPTRNVLYSVNPVESGIEVIQVCRFQLEDSERVVDGEYDYRNKYLIRRPVVLLDLRKLHEIYNETVGPDGRHALGQPDNNLQHSPECKTLPEVEPENFIIFGDDVGLREARLKLLESEGVSSKTSPRTSKKKEYELIGAWLDRYGENFQKAAEKGLTGDSDAEREMRTLCPVTWKTLELAFAHKVFHHDKEIISYLKEVPRTTHPKAI